MDAQSTQKTQDTKALIEAALFAAGRTLSVRELVQLSGLPEEMVRLFDRLSELGHGTVALIEVRAGLPRRLVIERNDLGVRR